jgi:hypothetical protein
MILALRLSIVDKDKLLALAYGYPPAFRSRDSGNEQKVHLPGLRGDVHVATDVLLHGKKALTGGCRAGMNGGVRAAHLLHHRLHFRDQLGGVRRARLS